MGQIDYLNGGSELADLVRRIRALEFSSNQNNMAIGRSGLRVHSGGVITIENGGLVVTGSATISGELIADGIITMTGTFTATGDVNLNGPVDIAGNTTITGDVTSAGHFTQTGPTDLNGTTTVAGDTTVTGDFTVNGPMKTTGTLSVEGVTTLKNDLNVTTGGKITAGNVTIDPDAFDGALQFGGGRVIYDTGSSLILSNGSSSAMISITGTQVILEAGSADIHVVNNTIGLNGDLEVTGDTYLNLPTTGTAANVYYDSGTGKLFYKP